MKEASPASTWETNTVRLRPVSQHLDRTHVVNLTFNDPHTNTLEDIDWIAAEFGLSKNDARRSFIDADFLFVIETLSGEPVYLICITPDGMAQTAMTPLLEANIIGVTRLLKRLANSEVSAVFKGTRTGCDIDDWRAKWIRFLGFEDAGRVQPKNGKEMIIFKHKGRV